MIRPTTINENPFEIIYYPLMVSPDKFNESCNAVDDLSTKIYVPSETKDINAKVFEILTRKNEAETYVMWF